jgi:adenylate kinase
MLKDKKLDFERGLEEYLEQQKLYELFESMMKTLIVNKPADPLAHLVNKLEQPESKLTLGSHESNISRCNCLSEAHSTR